MSRPLCSTCQRPLSVCYCSALVHIRNRIKVLIIQHPLEQKHPFNTGRMAHLCLENSELIVAERLADEQLAQLLKPNSALLYPSLSWLPDVDPVEPGTSRAGTLEQLTVIDATWRKSKKMLHLHPDLQRLPRVSFEGTLASEYRIRHSSLGNSLSTLESIALAMQQLEPGSDFQAMLRPFKHMVSLQIDVSGAGERGHR
ncbi:tRNA-uridine aminocarboxypropyltransferase [Microbulbifer harenosus]|uniref:tRNA-uridine aminocarboxypropyltransferase n=1 Tax=Microbulbifer harenosus TaxID=2576840 RepID=A0ABY2UJX7_9GAMM|nr:MULTISPECIES: tRNA-uridine aminocarboxypropyltransferase [Microbulbifer]QIL89279.1 DTW domain-containing protein [Microbulbifer sp. SH-1]TLM78580.1 DTW domain-containing protein [Microbulbifer harenosus]